MKIAIWGTELYAWTAAASFARMGNEVYFHPQYQSQGKTPPGRVNSATAPDMVKQEPGLVEQINAQQLEGRLHFCSANEAAEAGLHLLAFLPNQEQEAEALCKLLALDQTRELLIINTSNFGIGASDRLRQHLGGERQSLAYMPDQLPAGSALNYFTRPDHLIVGCENDWANMHIRALFRPFSQSLTSWLFMSAREAEYTKFAITGMLALRLAYINDLANLADQLNVDIDIIRQAMGSDERIGQHYLRPGCGFGGEHFPQYIKGLAGTLSEARNSHLLDTVLEQNEKQKELPFRKLWRHYDCDLAGKSISVWGLAYKPGSASISNAPSLKVIDALLSQDCIVKVHDPMAMSNIEKHFAQHPKAANLHRCESELEALQNSQGLLLLTEWPQYSSPDFVTMHQTMAEPLIIDGRNVFDKELLQELGFSYHGIGR
ncbi:MAG: nucleotide sugar dehydrogenase [Cellvibrionaceae bacterium]|nr:nucleotide sugar dehydrogenase [Cellvibrionaceae bacterium]MCV6627131.1 nucleotide sugar dehydrogenase [Cellvibrionaceae bacterium]